MGSRCLWHEEVRPVDQQWPCVPSLRRDELFSSWLVRCSLRNACDAVEVAQSLWPGRRIWTGDCDLSLSRHSLQVVAAKSGLDAADLFSSTLSAVCSLLNLDWPANGRTTWVIPLGKRNLRCAGGLQFCPCCFAAGIPYYRVDWRLAWCTCCPKHEVYLHDRCPHCRAILSPHRLGYRAMDLARCHQCGGLLAAARTVPIESADLFLANCVAKVLGGERLDNSWPCMAPADWFTLLRCLCRLVRALALHPTTAAQAFLRSLDVDLRALLTINSGLALEYLSVEERARYLSAASSILQAGELRFVAAANEVRLSAWVHRELLGTYLGTLLPAQPTRHYRTTARPTSSGPRKPETVVRAWYRFLRISSRTGVLH
ncbi:TniQ family protein [Pseudomonas chlororaphis]|uniref:TniQ family protein n=1 Tax=Pseudomonas chlororaphis TaxID=587753 RepID=UPI000E0A40BA|nr:hypothetical protein C4K25_5896 [Pseudomonas chlororaphis]